LHKLNRKKLHKYYLDSDLLILPNLDEKINNWTSPLKLFEYMATKRLIIASNIESLKEILIHNHNSILFNPNTENDLADKINFSVKYYNKDLVINAFEDVKEYTWTNRAKQILNFIK
jgi:glycosyltransferase involved in cell wall biosynthesis